MNPHFWILPYLCVGASTDAGFTTHYEAVEKPDSEPVVLTRQHFF
jgi:hypothetical protein